MAAYAPIMKLAVPLGFGIVFWKAMEGRAESEMQMRYGERVAGGRKGYDEGAMMTEVLRGGGETSLDRVREETNRRRRALAEQHTTYNRPVKEE